MSARKDWDRGEPSNLMADVRVEQSSHSWKHHGASNHTSIPPAKEILDVVHFHYSWILFLIFIVVFLITSISSANTTKAINDTVLLGPGGKPLPASARKIKEERERRQKLIEFSPGRRTLFKYLAASTLATFLANGVEIVIHALTKSENGWWCGKEMAIYVSSSAFFYSVILISLFDASPAPSIAHQVTWIVGLILELILLSATISLYTNQHATINSLRTSHSKLIRSPDQWESVEMSIAALRVLIFIFTIGFYIVFAIERYYRHKARRAESEESAPLLINGQANGEHVNGNGAIRTNAEGQPVGRKSLDDPPAFYKPTTVPNRTWWEYIRGYSVFFPYLWPSRSVKLQLVVMLCFLLVVLQRVVNLAVPLQIGRVTDVLSKTDGKVSEMPWLQISVLIGLKFLQGSSGILGAVRSVLWIPISQYSYRALTTASFEHVHSLSLDFHLGKRTGEVLSALSKGNAINNFLEQVTFSMLPMVFDLGVAIVLFGVKFDAYYALIVAIVTFLYLYLTIRMARWRSEQRRQMTTLGREEDAVKNDSLTSYETVKYFNAEAYEFNRYRKAVVAFQKMEYKVTISLNILNISQNMVFMTGLLATSFIAAYQVTTGQRKVGDFVVLLTYMAQLQQPLNFFGTFYRSVQSAMISGERLLELFKEQPTVVDDESAKAMPSCEGEIRFKHVKFSYDSRKPALEDLSFTCRPGTTTALVGESGGGKSTVFRLIYRYYNAQDGSIQVDGNDIKDITIDSLRRHIGVVPQDTILFNETLMYNLKYANQDATDEDVYRACQAASIHDKIMAFPDGYNTKVGERGLRLSGGEKQRVAIARTILKGPRIILLDEATAALDSTTEQNIQEALNTLSHGRTMLVIAHRLSTITTADQIVVLHAGQVAESGTHSELLAMKGRYASMWRKQIRAERAADEAAAAVAKAQALQKAAADRPGSPHEGNSADVSDNEAETRAPSIMVTDGASSFTHVDETRDRKSDDGKSDDGAVAKVLKDDLKATTSEDRKPGSTQ